MQTGFIYSNSITLGLGPVRVIPQQCEVLIIGTTGGGKLRCVRILPSTQISCESKMVHALIINNTHTRVCVTTL